MTHGRKLKSQILFNLDQRRYILAALSCSALILAMIRIGHFAFWADEVNGYYLYRHEFTHWWNLLRQNWHEDPPLFGIFFWLWIKGAEHNVFLLRFFAPIFYALTIPVAYLVGKKLMNPHFGILVAGVMTFSPYLILWSRAARWYSFFLFLIACSSYYFLMATTEKRFRWWIGYIVATTLAIYTNYYGFVFIVGHTIYLALRYWKQWKLWGHWIIAHFIIMVLYLPWIDTLVRQAHASTNAGSLSLLGLGQSLGYTLFAFVAGQTVLPWDWFITVPLFFVGLGVMVWALREWRALLYPWVMVIVPMGLATLSGTLNAWRGIAHSFFFYMVLVAGFYGIGKKYKRYGQVLWLLITILWFVSLINLYTGRQYQKLAWLDPWRDIVAFMNEYIEEGDAIAHISPSLNFYLEWPLGIDEMTRQNPKLIWTSSNVFDKRVAVLPLTSWKQKFAELQSTNDWNGRIWFFETTTGYNAVTQRQLQAEEGLKKFLDTRGHLIQKRAFHRDPNRGMKKRLFPQQHLPEYRIKTSVYQLKR